MAIGISDNINIHRPSDFAIKSALRLGFVRHSFIPSELKFHQQQLRLSQVHLRKLAQKSFYISIP